MAHSDEPYNPVSYIYLHHLTVIVQIWYQFFHTLFKNSVTYVFDPLIARPAEIYQPFIEVYGKKVVNDGKVS